MATKKQPEIVIRPRPDLSSWSVDRERKRLEHDAEERARLEGKPIFEREIAERIAADAAATIIPNWRHVRQDHGQLWRDLLNQQPEIQLKEVRQADHVLRVIRDALPSHIAALLTDYVMILNFRFTAHESASFLIGLATGRLLERQHVDAKGRIHSRRSSSKNSEPFRLHSGD